jgi:SnoaL-like domain
MNANSEADRVRALVTVVVHEIDSKRWTELTNLFAPRVETDYTSLFGGTPQTQTREELVAGWRAALERVTTQHLLGPIDLFVEGSGAAASCRVRARFTTRRGRRAASTGKCSDTTCSR